MFVDEAPESEAVQEFSQRLRGNSHGDDSDDATNIQPSTIDKTVELYKIGPCMIQLH